MPHPKRVLLVDDDVPVLRATERLLAGLGYQVTSCTLVGKALAAFESAPDSYDLVISDYWMPDMSGCELLRWVRALRSEVAVLLITGDEEENLDFPCLTKPYNLKALSSAVRDAIALADGSPA